MNKRKPLRERFERNYTPEPNSGCWLWLGSTSTEGYGQIRADGVKRKTLVAHRVAYELYHAISIPDGMYALHRCDTPMCVNPNHIFLGTQKENVRDCISKGRFGGRKRQLKCGRGHDLSDPESTYLIKSRSGQISRTCRKCSIMRSTEYHKRKRQRHVAS